MPPTATALGPHAVQLSEGGTVLTAAISMQDAHLDRPADECVPTGQGSHAMYSDDGGRSWALSQNDMAGGDECQAAQLANGSLIMNQRTATAARPAENPLASRSLCSAHSF